MKQHKCVNCGKVLFEYNIQQGTVRRRCGNCKTMNEVEVTPEITGPSGILSRIIEPADRIRVNGSPETRL